MASQLVEQHGQEVGEFEGLATYGAFHAALRGLPPTRPGLSFSYICELLAVLTYDVNISYNSFVILQGGYQSLY